MPKHLVFLRGGEFYTMNIETGECKFLYETIIEGQVHIMEIYNDKLYVVSDTMLMELNLITKNYRELPIRIYEEPMNFEQISIHGDIIKLSYLSENHYGEMNIHGINFIEDIPSARNSRHAYEQYIEHPNLVVKDIDSAQTYTFVPDCNIVTRSECNCQIYIQPLVIKQGHGIFRVAQEMISI